MSRGLAFDINIDDVPVAIREAFEASPLLGMPQISKLLPMDWETLRAHVAAGNLVGRVKGFGIKKPRRVFTLADIARFLARLMEPTPCQPIAAPVPNSTPMISRSKVIAFPAQPGLRMNVQPPTSRKPKGPKQRHSSPTS